MGDFFDLNNDGKLDWVEASMKDAHIMNCIDQLEKQDNTPSAGSGSSTNQTTFDPNSRTDNYLAAFGAGVLGIAALFAGGFTVKYLQGLGILLLIGGIILMIIALVYLAKGAKH